MRLSWKAAIVLAAMLPAPAMAGIYSDDLAKCLVKSSTPDDQIALMRWLFGAMALHPAIQQYSTITPEQREEFNTKVSTLLVRLVTVDCRTQTVAALKYEGPSIFETSFRVLGEVAMRGLMTDPKVAEGFSQWATHLDKDKLNALYAEAGLPLANPPPK